MSKASSKTLSERLNTRKLQPRPPLPFRGNKSCIKQPLIDTLQRFKDFPVFVDLFGGSLYVAYLIHHVIPSAHVIVNDFDNYEEKLKRWRDTNELLQQLQECKSRAYGHEERIDPIDKEKMDEILKSASFVDLFTITTKLAYSNSNAETMEHLLKSSFYNRPMGLKINDDIVNDYLEGLDIRRTDWRLLFDEFKDRPDVVFIADPPYYNTNNGGYCGYKWTMKDSINTLEILKAPRFLYFTGLVTYILEFIEYLQREGILPPLNIQKYARAAKLWKKPLEDGTNANVDVIITPKCNLNLTSEQ